MPGSASSPSYTALLSTGPRTPGLGVALLCAWCLLAGEPVPGGWASVGLSSAALGRSGEEGGTRSWPESAPSRGASPPSPTPQFAFPRARSSVPQAKSTLSSCCKACPTTQPLAPRRGCGGAEHVDLVTAFWTLARSCGSRDWARRKPRSGRIPPSRGRRRGRAGTAPNPACLGETGDGAGSFQFVPVMALT